MNQQFKTEKGRMLTIVGIVAMIAFVATKALGLNIEGYSIIVGVALFFIVEAVEKTPETESGLRLTTIISDLKKPGVLIWLMLPVISSIGSILLGNVLFGNGFIDHVLGRTDSLLSFDRIVLLIGQLVVGAMGEEIAFRGFFVGKGQKVFPYWSCALISSLAFAAAHYAAGEVGVVLYDLIGIFIDSLIYSQIYRKTDNCIISTIAHFLCNAVGLILTFVFFK